SMTPSASFATPKFEVKAQASPGTTATKIEVDRLNFYYGKTQALRDISIEIPERQVMAFIGPSGCGKTTFLRTLNRMNDVIAGTRVEGKMAIDGEDIYAACAVVVDLRVEVGMAFQQSSPF